MPPPRCAGRHMPLVGRHRRREIWEMKGLGLYACALMINDEGLSIYILLESVTRMSLCLIY